MGRNRKHDKGLPKRVYCRRGKFYYVSLDGRWLPLGATKPEMYRRLAELEAGTQAGTVGALLTRYLDEVTPKKAKATQTQDHLWAEKLRAVFGEAQAASIRPTDIARYLDTRTAKVAANREKALLSHAYSMGMRWGLVDANPCRGIHRNPEAPRTRYPTHEELEAVGRHASPWLIRFLRLAYLTGQRPSDVRLLQRQQITEDGILFRPRKTRRKTNTSLLVRWTPALRSAATDALEHAGDMLLFHHRRKPYTHGALNSAWKRAMAKAIAAGDLTESFQLRDLRAKSGTDGKDQNLLGHTTSAVFDKHYRRKPKSVEPVA